MIKLITHTQGPWLGNAWTGSGDYEIEAPSGRAVATIKGCYENSEANARLITEAPNLFYVLEYVLLAHTHDGALTTGSALLSPAIENKIKNAINKAKGTT